MMNDVPLRKHGRFWVHDWASGQDWAIWEEVYFHDCYRLGAVEPYRKNEVIVDVGASVGAFCLKAKEHNPQAKIIAFEPCPENIPVLRANAGEFASIIQAAVTYEQNLSMLNAVFPNCTSTGGSIVTNDDAALAAAATDGRYKIDRRPIQTFTLERIYDDFKIDRIDILKLDCEGSEFSILGNTTSLDRIEMIVGEYHGWTRFNELVTRVFRPDWHLTIISGGELGIFWLNRWRNLERNGVYL
jgi:FkbM family methyltransferase